jgi:hypothetical protein
MSIKEGSAKSAALNDTDQTSLSTGSGRCASGAGAAARVKIHRAGKPKTNIDKIYFDGLDLFDEILVDDILKTVNVVNLVCVFWLIQSQRQRRAASAAGVEEDTDR